MSLNCLTVSRHILTRYLVSVSVICLPTQLQASVSPDTRLPSPARLSQVSPLQVSASRREKLSWSWHRDIVTLSWHVWWWPTWVCDHRLPDCETPRKMEAPATPQMTRVPREQTVMWSSVSWLNDQNMLSEYYGSQLPAVIRNIAASWLMCGPSLAPSFLTIFRKSLPAFLHMSPNQYDFKSTHEGNCRGELQAHVHLFMLHTQLKTDLFAYCFAENLCFWPEKAL